MGGSSSNCRYTNQGERIDEYRDKIFCIYLYMSICI